jgi:DNA-binding NtrC family response regulator
MEEKNRVMVLDDEPIVCERLRSMLEKMNLDVETFVEPGKALKRIVETPFQVLITDLKMKEMDGIEMLKITQKVSPQTKVIMITGFATVEKAKQALQMGVFDFIAKPFKLSQLRDLVAKALNLSASAEKI